MANTIIFKKSSVPDKIPLIGDLTTGELAINTADGILYTKKDDNTITALGVSFIGRDEYVATGAISAGDVVGLRSDGTVEVISSTIVSHSVGNDTQFYSSSNIIGTSVVYDSVNEKVVIVYTTSTSGCFAIVGTVSGTSISFGTPVLFSADSDFVSSTYDSTNQKVVIAYEDLNNANYGTAIVGTVSGTTISFGNTSVFNYAETEYTSIAYDAANGRVVIAYHDRGTSFAGTATVGTVSGTGISFGNEYVFNADFTYDISVAYDIANEKVVIAYHGNTDGSRAVVGTVSGTSISFGSFTSFASGNGRSMVSTYDSANQKVVIAYQNQSSIDNLVMVGTVSGTSISFGSATIFTSEYTSDMTLTYDPTNKNVIITFQGVSNRGTLLNATISGTSISIGSGLTFNSTTTSNIGSTYDSTNQKVVIAYEDSGSLDGRGVVYTPEVLNTNVNSTIGISSKTLANTEAGDIVVITGIDENQTGLIPATLYYVQHDGVITATPFTPNSQYEYKKLGRALSATEILIEGIE